MATIIIKRQGEFRSVFNDFHIILDGKNVGTISKGQTKEFKVVSGQHELKAEIAWCSSPMVSFTVSEDEKKEYIVQVDEFNKLTVLFTTLVIGVFMVVNWILNLNKIYNVFLYCAVLLFVIYNTIIRRNKYLNIISL